MTTLFTLLISVSLLSVLAESFYLHKDAPEGTIYDYKHRIEEKQGSLLLVAIVAMVLTLFSGLRTEHNDTYAYIKEYINNIPLSLPAISDLDLSLSNNPGYFIYQVLIKQFVSIDPQVYLFITAIIVNFIFIFFYYKYSPKFSLNIFLFVASGLFIFTMAAMKQTLAMAIGLWAIHYSLRNKWIISVLLMVVAVTIHPYVIFYGLAILFKKKIWSIREYLILFSTVVGVLYFESFALFIGDVHALIGEDIGYELLMGTGINYFRVLVYAVPPALSFIYQKKLRTLQNPMVNISVNFSIIAFLFTFIALWGDPILLGRMAIYFSPFSILTLTIVIMHCFSKSWRFAVTSLAIIFYSIYFYYQYGVAQPFVYKNIIGPLL